MKLSKNFSLDELTASNTAIKNNIDNSASPDIVDALQELVTNVLQPVREKFGPVTITSGYRCDELNRAIGGSTTSDHSYGRAADFEVKGVDNRVVAIWITENLPYKQLILEFYNDGETNSGWIHCSYDKDNNKKQKLKALKDGKRTVYVEADW
jgi:hypothetical protein